MTPAGWGARETGCCTLAACHHSVCLRRRGAVRPPERRSREISLLGRGWGGGSARARCGGTNSRRSTVPAGFSLPAVPTTRQTSPPAEKSRDRAHRVAGARTPPPLSLEAEESAPQPIATHHPPPHRPVPAPYWSAGARKKKKRWSRVSARDTAHTRRGARNPPNFHRSTASLPFPPATSSPGRRCAVCWHPAPPSEPRKQRRAATGGTLFPPNPLSRPPSVRASPLEPVHAGRAGWPLLPQFSPTAMGSAAPTGPCRLVSARPSHSLFPVPRLVWSPC